jgi:hypothetical protein
MTGDFALSVVAGFFVAMVIIAFGSLVERPVRSARNVDRDYDPWSVD